MNANLNGKEYLVAFNYATFFEYEERFNKNLADATTQRSMLQLYYCCLIANNPEFTIDFPDFTAFLAALESDENNTVEVVCTTRYAMYCNSLKKKILKNQAAGSR